MSRLSDWHTAPQFHVLAGTGLFRFREHFERPCWSEV